MPQSRYEKTGGAMMRLTERLSQISAFPFGAGIICAALGLTVLAGWYTHDLALIHVLPAFVGMAFNTALGFFFGGSALAAAAMGRPRLALFSTVFALLVGIPTLAEYVTGRNFGLDEMLMPAYTRAGVTQMGRMAIATACGFILLGLVFLCLNLPESRKGRYAAEGRYAAAGLLGALIVSLGMIALSGYITGITASYTWGQLTRMAVHTATGFVLMGLGIIALVWRGEKAQEQEAGAAPRWLPGLVGIASAAASLCLWQDLIVQERAQTALMAHLALLAGVSLHKTPNTGMILTNGSLAAGLLVSALLAGAVSLAQTARRQSAALEQARDEMEARVQERTAELAKANKSLGVANEAMRDVLLSVTDGKLRLCDKPNQLPLPLGHEKMPIPLGRHDVKTLRSHVRRIAEEAGLTRERSDDLETAVGEAGMNAVVHGLDAVGEVYAGATGTVQVWVTDRGGGIDMEHLPRATLERGYTTAGTLGHGFWLMLNTVDRVWLLTGTTGTTIVIEQDAVAPPPAWLRALDEIAV